MAIYEPKGANKDSSSKRDSGTLHLFFLARPLSIRNTENETRLRTMIPRAIDSNHDITVHPARSAHIRVRIYEDRTFSIKDGHYKQVEMWHPLLNEKSSFSRT